VGFDIPTAKEKTSVSQMIKRIKLEKKIVCRGKSTIVGVGRKFSPNQLPNPFNIHWVEFIIKSALLLLNPNQTNPIVNGLGLRVVHKIKNDFFMDKTPILFYFCL
jgi:hypothetical protein